MPKVKEVGFRPVAIKSKDWVTIIVEKDGKFLREKQLRFGIMKESHEFPCGLVEDGELPKNAALRELREETGILISGDVEKVKYLGTFAANPAFMTNHMHYFYVNLDDVEYDVVETEFDEHEKLETYWEDKKTTIEKTINNPNTSSLMAGCICLMQKEGII